MRWIYAILSLVGGILMIFRGYQIARFIIPFMGFLTGLSLGGAVIADLNDTPFLASIVGITVGVSLGLLLAVLAYAYYYVAVIILAGGLGYWVGSGFLLMIGVDPGILTAVVGFAAGVLIGIVAIMANAPKYMLVALTSIVGAVASIGGIMLIVGAIPLNAFSYNTAGLAIRGSWFWSLGALALAIIGMVVQTEDARTSEDFIAWGTHDDHSSHNVPPTTHPRSAH